jgi:SAM-dependent methyltransferase
MVDLSKLDPEMMASQLGKPDGEIGRALADSMAERNWPVYEEAFRRLGVGPNERFFEVGFGNGKLVRRLLGLGSGITYAGIDFSEAMVSEADSFNRLLIADGKVEFRVASVEAIPFADRTFDRALTVNTVYFWPKPDQAFAEIRRVLRPGGVLLVAVGTPEQMAKFPPSRHGFRLYNSDQLNKLLGNAGFQNVAVEIFRDRAPTLDRRSATERETLFAIGVA